MMKPESVNQYKTLIETYDDIKLTYFSSLEYTNKKCVAPVLVTFTPGFKVHFKGFPALFSHV